MPDLQVNMSGVMWKNPVTTASGTFGCGREFVKFYDLSRLGAITVKGVSDKPWPGNPPPRVTETHGGMLNSIGLQNNGVLAFIRDDIPFLKQYDVKAIVNVCGHSTAEYCAVIEQLADTGIDMLELNVSCPNVSAGGMAIGTNSKMIYETVGACKKLSRQPMYVKLSPNVTDITEMAKAAEAAGADGLSLINTLLGMKIDINKKKPLLGNGVGGLSGPAVMPVAVRMVYQVFEAVKIPIIGMGGIACADDAIEFLLAGASAVAVGMANFVNPYAAPEIVEGIEAYLSANNYNSITEIIGLAHK